MPKRSWNKVRTGKLREAMKLCTEYAQQKHNRSVDRVAELMEEVCEQTAEAGNVVRTHADDPAMAETWIDAGAQYVAVSVDGALLTQTFSDVADAISR
jgi:2-keto-3-deoxy-L-rhamnonate aldolase RhmA